MGWKHTKHAKYMKNPTRYRCVKCNRNMVNVAIKDGLIFCKTCITKNLIIERRSGNPLGLKKNWGEYVK